MILAQPNKEIRDFLSAKHTELQESIRQLTRDPYAIFTDITTNIGCKITIHKQMPPNPNDTRVHSLVVELFNSESGCCEAQAFFTYNSDYDDSQDITDWCIAKFVDYLMRG